jgi:hypothetical protein
LARDSGFAAVDADGLECLLSTHICHSIRRDVNGNFKVITDIRAAMLGK